MCGLLATEVFVPVNANLTTMQASWKAFLKRLKQKRRSAIPNLVSVRRLGKRIITGELKLKISNPIILNFNISNKKIFPACNFLFKQNFYNSILRLRFSNVP